MTTNDLIERHESASHPCDVHSGPVPQLIVTCRRCGARLEAELLSPCVGARHDERVILMLRCPSCDATGQLRLQRDAFGSLVPPVPASPTGDMTVAQGGAGYLSVRCGSCDPRFGYGVLLQRHAVTEHELVLEGVSLGCGHRVELRLPRTSTFRVKDHHHCRRPGREAAAQA